MLSRAKKILSLILSMIIMFSLVAHAVDFQDNYPNTHTNTGDYITDLIAVAKTQIGYSELDLTTGNSIAHDGAAGYTKYGESFGDPIGEWCAYFVSWCAREADIPTSVLPQLGNCAAMVKWYKKYSAFRTPSSGYIPKAGDIVFYNWSGGETAKHVGIVTGVLGDNLYTIEGNTGDGRGYDCLSRTRKCSADYIVGYGVLDCLLDRCSIIDATCEKIFDLYHAFTVTVKGRPTMLKFIEAGGNTRIFNRSDAVSITSYDVDGNEVKSLDRTADHEVWVILTSPIEKDFSMQLRFVSDEKYIWGNYIHRFIFNDVDTDNI